MLFAGVIAVFGDAPTVFRWMGVVSSVTSLFLIYGFLRRISSGPAALLGVILFSVVSSDPGTGGEGVNREVFMNTLVLAAWWLATLWRRPGTGLASFASQDSDETETNGGRDSQARRNLAIAGAGLSLGLASLLKTNVAVYWFLLAAWIVLCASRRNSGRHAATTLSTLAAFSIGPALLWASTFVYFAATGRLQDMVDAVFLVNLDYADTKGAFLSRFAMFFTPPRFPHVFDSAFPLWLGAGTALAWLLITSIVRRNSARLLVLVLATAAYLAVCLPGRFWPHYYFLLIPPAVIAAATCLGSIIGAISSITARRGLSPLRFVIPVVFVAAVMTTEYRHYLSINGIEITKARYNTRDFWGRAQGRSVARVTSPEDSVFVYGNDAAIYYYSGRKCASRYTMITGLHPQMRGFEERRRRLMEDLRAARPRLILVVFDQEPFEDWKAFLNAEYGQPVGWDFHDETGKPIMFVLARKDAPVESIEWNWDRAEAAASSILPSAP